MILPCVSRREQRQSKEDQIKELMEQLQWITCQLDHLTSLQEQQ